MATPRLPFLYPMLFRPLRPTVRSATESVTNAVRPPPRAGFRSSQRRQAPETIAVSQRYGTANEPPIHFVGVPLSGPSPKIVPNPLPEPEKSEDQKARPPTAPASPLVMAAQKNSDAAIEAASVAQEALASLEQAGAVAAATTGAVQGDSLKTILQMDPPMADNSKEKLPHLQSPPYEHHFDSYTLVKNLGEGNWSEEQAVTAMKAVRSLLAANMEIAREGLVSKSDAEMESYLFRAACTELRTEIRNNRQTTTEKMRSERTQLQHEVDILSQRITQDVAGLKDELKGMFDDRRMAVRMERRNAENQIQELNYKITLKLSSEMRSEAEGLRWVLTRRTALALVFLVTMAILTLRFATYMEKKQEAERKKFAAEMAARERDMHFEVPLIHRGVDMSSGEVLKRLEDGDSPALVSLG